ncbi:hypothetical protein V1288_006507 [Bradyrhizobium sp. AZCC 2176]
MLGNVQNSRAKANVIPAFLRQGPVSALRQS